VSVEEREPDVIVDFVFDDGLLYATVANIGDRPALKVSCRFEPAFHGLGGSVEISRLPLFRNIEYLAPFKEIRTLVDSSAAYFARKEPTKLEVTVTYRDESGTRRGDDAARSGHLPRPRLRPARAPSRRLRGLTRSALT
jgi:hypothetical protein